MADVLRTLNVQIDVLDNGNFVISEPNENPAQHHHASIKPEWIEAIGHAMVSRFIARAKRELEREAERAAREADEAYISSRLDAIFADPDTFRSDSIDTDVFPEREAAPMFEAVGIIVVDVQDDFIDPAHDFPNALVHPSDTGEDGIDAAKNFLSARPVDWAMDSGNERLSKVAFNLYRAEREGNSEYLTLTEAADFLFNGLGWGQM